MLQVMSRPPTPAPLAPSDPLPSAPSAVMSSDSTRSSSNGCFLPVLTMSNFLKWRLCAMAYLTLQDYVRVLERTSSAAHGRMDGSSPVAPMNAKELESWGQSGRMPCRIIVSTAVDLHPEFVHKRKQGSVWRPWLTIEAKHIQHDASFRHGAWMSLTRISSIVLATHAIRSILPCLLPYFLARTSCYSSLVAYAKVIPFAVRRQLVSQKNTCLDDVIVPAH